MPLATNRAAAYTGIITIVFKGIAMWPITVLLIESNPHAAQHVAHHLRAVNIAVDIPRKTSDITNFLAAPSTASARPRVAYPAYRAVIMAETFHAIHACHLLPAIRRLSMGMHVPVIIGSDIRNLSLPGRPHAVVMRQTAKTGIEWYLSELYDTLRPHLI